MSFLQNIGGRAVLAPMAGVTDRVFRALCREYGCPYAVTEMVSAKGFLSSRRLSYGRGLLDTAPGEVVAAQLFGSEPKAVAEAAAILSDGPFCAIDLNMGCPAPKITGGGDGCALMRTPSIAVAVARETVRASQLPVTVKMRLGWDERCHVDFARRMEDAGVAALAVHGRTRAQFYSGAADWDAVAEVVAAVSIPVLANGDVRGVDSFLAALSHTGCHAVMIGRGALGNPFIFRQIEDSIAGREVREVSARDRMQAAMRHARMLCAYKGDLYAIPEMRKHASWYISGLYGGAALRREVHSASTLSGLLNLLDGFA